MLELRHTVDAQSLLINFHISRWPADMRFSINFFTSIGLGGLTDRSRDEYKAALARQAQQQAALAAAKVEVSHHHHTATHLM